MKDERIHCLCSKGFQFGINYSEITLEEEAFLSEFFEIEKDKKRKKVFLRDIDKNKKKKEA